MMIEPLIKELLDAGVHFGHQTHRWNPKMKRFIFGEKNGIYLVDLEKTAKSLTEAQEFLRSVAAKGEPILFVGTKRQAQKIIAEEAVRCGQFYVNLRWLGGLLTNFQTIRKSIDRLKTIRTWREDGTLERFTKKEAAQFESEVTRLEKVLGGVIEMPRLPKAMYVVDAKREETAVREAIRLKIPVVALVDTNSDPDPIAYPIPGNDDALRSIKLVTARLADAILEGRQTYLAGVTQEKEKEEAEKAREEAEKAKEEDEEAQRKKDKEAAEAEPQLKSDKPLVPVEELNAPLEEEKVIEKIVPEAIVKTKVEIDEPPKKKTSKSQPQQDKKKEQGSSEK